METRDWFVLLSQLGLVFSIVELAASCRNYNYRWMIVFPVVVVVLGIFVVPHEKSVSELLLLVFCCVSVLATLIYTIQYILERDAPPRYLFFFRKNYVKSVDAFVFYKWFRKNEIFGVVSNHQTVSRETVSRVLQYRTQTITTNGSLSYLTSLLEECLEQRHNPTEIVKSYVREHLWSWCVTKDLPVGPVVIPLLEIAESETTLSRNSIRDLVQYLKTMDVESTGTRFY